MFGAAPARCLYGRHSAWQALAAAETHGQHRRRMGSTGSDGAERGNVLSWHAETTEAEGAVARCHMARDGRVPGGRRACWRCVMHVEMTEATVARRRVMCDGHAST